MADLTEGQIRDLVKAREAYLHQTRKILLQRQSLWQGVTSNLANVGLRDGAFTTDSKMRTFERVIDLRHNMDAYHWNFAKIVREWLLCILSPLQVPPLTSLPHMHRLCHIAPA